MLTLGVRLEILLILQGLIGNSFESFLVWKWSNLCWQHNQHIMLIELRGYYDDGDPGTYSLTSESVSAHNHDQYQLP